MDCFHLVWPFSTVCGLNERFKCISMSLKSNMKINGHWYLNKRGEFSKLGTNKVPKQLSIPLYVQPFVRNCDSLEYDQVYYLANQYTNGNITSEKHFLLMYYFRLLNRNKFVCNYFQLKIQQNEKSFHSNSNKVNNWYNLETNVYRNGQKHAIMKKPSSFWCMDFTIDWFQNYGRLGWKNMECIRDEKSQFVWESDLHFKMKSLNTSISTFIWNENFLYIG